MYPATNFNRPRSLRGAWVIVVLLGLASEPARAAAPSSTWFGYQRVDFTVARRACTIVFPSTPAAGNPWIWRPEFFGHEPQADVALLQRGYHVVYMDLRDMYGGPEAMRYMYSFYRYLLRTYSLSPRAVLVGFSRGGLFAFNWAARNPHAVACLYVDAPVCDFKSWPAGFGQGKGSPSNWKKCLEAYGLNEQQAREYRYNPVDNLAPLARAGIPILSVCGDADEVVPFAENTGLLAPRYRELGGTIEVIVKPGVGHHPHSLPDPTPIVDFIERHTAARR